METSTIYPFLPVEVEFEFTDEPVFLYILASKDHYGLLIPMDTLPEITPAEEGGDPIKRLFNVLTEEFPKFARIYRKATKEHHFPEQLPRLKNVDLEFGGEFYDCAGHMTIMKDESGKLEDMPMEGRYLLVAETEVSLQEFLGKNNPAPH